MHTSLEYVGRKGDVGTVSSPCAKALCIYQLHSNCNALLTFFLANYASSFDSTVYFLLRVCSGDKVAAAGGPTSHGWPSFEL
jgi:hypothetical protein